MPIAADAKGVESIRKSVKSWACGYRPRRALAKRAKRKKGKAAASKPGTTASKQSGKVSAKAKD
jgi:hypothetical protein